MVSKGVLSSQPVGNFLVWGYLVGFRSRPSGEGFVFCCSSSISCPCVNCTSCPGGDCLSLIVSTCTTPVYLNQGSPWSVCGLVCVSPPYLNEVLWFWSPRSLLTPDLPAHEQVRSGLKRTSKNMCQTFLFFSRLDCFWGYEQVKSGVSLLIWTDVRGSLLYFCTAPSENIWSF